MKIFIYLLYVHIVVAVTARSERHWNNACPTNFDYNTKFFNKKCWYNSDVDLPVPVIIQNHNYPYEKHDIITDDGYKLPLFRIPYGKNAIKDSSKISQPVLLLHGIFCSSAPFVTYGNKSIGFILADEGYDVWLGNTRGSTYAEGHINYSTHDMRYWNFSFHEIGIYDVPKHLDLIYNVTGRNDIIFVGQSMGTNDQLVYASELPDHARQRVKFMVYLGPTVFLLEVKSPIVTLAPLWPELQELAGTFRIGELLSKNQFPTSLNKMLCLESELQSLICEMTMMSLMGFDFENFPPEMLPIILAHYPAGSSVKTGVHLAQNYMSKRFCKYDYGPKRNKIVYNSIKPPDYNISRVPIPGVIMYGVNDYLATKPGALALYNGLPKDNILFEINNVRHTHIDFFYSRNVVNDTINNMLEFMIKYKSTIPL